MVQLPHPDPALSPVLPHHRVSVRGRQGALELDLQAGFSAPWTVFFGPSGGGKTTLLRALCGLTPGLEVKFARFAEGEWRDKGQWKDLAPSLSPELRQLAFAPQQAALFPHLTVLENITFPRIVRRRAAALSPLSSELLSLFDLHALAARRPQHLSGGERQRVSLARAFAVPDARLLLLDEPFAGLDRTLRDALLPRMRSWLAERRLPVLSVTHDIEEAVLLQAEVIRLENGRNAAQGPAREILANEIAHLLSALGEGQEICLSPPDLAPPDLTGFPKPRT